VIPARKAICFRRTLVFRSISSIQCVPHSSPIPFPPLSRSFKFKHLNKMDPVYTSTLLDSGRFFLKGGFSLTRAGFRAPLQPSKALSNLHNPSFSPVASACSSWSGLTSSLQHSWSEEALIFIVSSSFCSY